MSWAIVTIIVILGLFLSGFFSGAETGLYRADRVRLYLGVQQRDPRALRLASVLDDEAGALCVTLVGTNMANYVTTSTVAYTFAELLGYGETHCELYTVAMVTPVIFVFGEMIPKNLFQLHPDTLLAHGNRLLMIADRVFRTIGVVWVLKHLAAGLNRVTGNTTELVGAFGPKQRVAGLLQEAVAGSDIGEEQSDLIERVCRLSETPLSAVMIPRNRVSVLSTGTSRKAFLRLARKTPHARLPVYEANVRRIVGTAEVDRLLQDADWRHVGERIHRPVTMRPHETVAAAITHLQRSRASMAIVTDRGGQMLGVVTLRDLLGEVLGDLATGI